MASNSRDGELRQQAERARKKLLSLPPETLSASFAKEPVGLTVVTILTLPVVALGLALVGAFLPFELPPGIALIAGPVCVAAWVVADNNKKHEQNQKKYKSDYPTTIAREYCKRFDTKDKLWKDMDILWREGDRRTRNWLAGEMLKKFEEPE